ncbi:MAG: succinylglutamate desuccinylase [Gemmatimonadetes bacterium]|nr:succinylglutamate desuccinylase [Gemmatimonadota bacterium]
MKPLQCFVATVLATVVASVIAPGVIPVAFAQGPLTIGNVTARPGESRSGAIAIPAGSDAGTEIPITIVRGSRPGPTLALIAGTHGSEVAPIVGLQRVRERVQANDLAGTLVLVHVANLPSFLGRTVYYSPVDGKNLNRVYPGKRDGTVSERIAFAITNEIIERSDFVVDMHAGDGNEWLRPYTYWSPLGLDARTDSVARELALAFGHDHIVVDRERPTDPARSLYTQNTAQLRRKPSITTETGALGMPAEAMVQKNYEGAIRLLRYLKMLGGPLTMVTAPVYLDRLEVLRSPETGVWQAWVEPGHTVAAGAVIGVLTDFAGHQLAEVRAPFDGEVMYVIGTPAMNRGEPVGMVAARSR